MNKLLAAAVAALALSASARAADAAAAAGAAPTPLVVRVIPAGGFDLKMGGIIQAWYQTQTAAPSSFLVRNARVYFTGDPSPYVSFNIMPAFMSPQGLVLLNAYIDVKPMDHLSFRAGQFVTPFGQNRMLPPGDLELANFHLTRLIFPGFASDLGWDVGAQARWSDKYFDVRGAVINGTGLNVTKDTDTAKDLTARADFFPLGDKSAVLGSSYYWGTSHSPTSVAPLIADKRTWWGGHALYSFFRERGLLQAEIISRSDRQRLWTLQGSWKFKLWSKDWQAVADWERFDPTAGRYTKRVTAGLNYWIDWRTRLTANWFADNNGITTHNGVVQLQVVF